MRAIPDVAKDGRQSLGKLGEDLACAELSRRGYELLDRRYRTRFGEIDIVARHQGVIVFVEVKARGSAVFGDGAGAVTGAMHLLAGRKARANVVGICALVENMPSGNAQRPGDVVTSMSGQTIEVINTDAEGRLILCDAMWYAQDKFEPEIMVELSTLTGAIIVALGHERAGLFSNNTQLSNRLRAAGAGIGEKLWRLPLGSKYDKMIDSEIADMRNVTNSRDASSITAAQFLQRFVQEGVAWAHLDIAGVAWSTKGDSTTPKGATAFGVRLLDALIAENYER